MAANKNVSHGVHERLDKYKWVVSTVCRTGAAQLGK